MLEASNRIFECKLKPLAFESPHGPSRGALLLYRWPTPPAYPLVSRTGGIPMPYVTEQAAYHGVRAETREAGEDAPSHL